MSLDGNTYRFASDDDVEKTVFLLCFDFTRERFAPLLPFPSFQCMYRDVVALSSVGEEQLAVLIHCWEHMEIWITSKIEPNAVSWSSKFCLAMNIITTAITTASFFVDEEKNVPVVFNKNKKGLMKNTRNGHRIIRRSIVELEESSYKHCIPLVCSYVPSLVQLY